MRTKADRISDTESHASYPSYRRPHDRNGRQGGRMAEERMSEPSQRTYYQQEEEEEEGSAVLAIGFMWKAAILLTFIVALAALIIGIIAYVSSKQLCKVTEAQKLGNFHEICCTSAFGIMIRSLFNLLTLIGDRSNNFATQMCCFLYLSQTFGIRSRF